MKLITRLIFALCFLLYLGECKAQLNYTAKAIEWLNADSTTVSNYAIADSMAGRTTMWLYLNKNMVPYTPRVIIATPDSIRYYDLLSSGGGDVTTANNGLLETGNNIQLGGVLTKNTTVNGPFILSITGSSATFGSDAGNTVVTSSGQITLSPTTNLILSNQTGAGSRMLQVDGTGIVSNAAIPSGISGLTSPRVPFAASATSLTDNAGLSFNAAGTRLDATNATVSTALINSALTNTRVPIIGASGLFTDDADLVWSSANNALSSGRFIGTPTTTLPSLNIGSFAGNPSTLNTGDFWYNSSVSGLFFRGAATQFMMLNPSPVTNGITYQASTVNGAVGNEAAFTYNATTNVLAADNATISTQLINTPLSVNRLPYIDPSTAGLFTSDADFNISTTSSINNLNIGDATGTETGRLTLSGFTGALAPTLTLDARATGRTSIYAGGHLVIKGTTTGSQIWLTAPTAGGAVYVNGGGTGGSGFVTLADSTASLQIGKPSTTTLSTSGVVFSSTYTPTLSNTTNVTSSTAYVCQGTRVGVNVTLSCRVDVTPTAPTTTTLLGISLGTGLTSNFTTSQDGGGTAYGGSSTGYITTDATNDNLSLNFTSGAGASSFWFTVQYIIK